MRPRHIFILFITGGVWSDPPPSALFILFLTGGVWSAPLPPPPPWYIYVIPDRWSLKWYPSVIYLYYSWQVVIEVIPSYAVFEATIRHSTSNSGYTVEKDIGRLNLYKDQPNCILDTHPNLRKFCFCNEWLASKSSLRVYINKINDSNCNKRLFSPGLNMYISRIELNHWKDDYFYLT